MSAVVKRSVSIRGHRTSYSLEKPFHDELARIGAERAIAIAQLIAEVDETRSKDSNLSSALRLYVLDWYRRRADTTRG